MARAAHPYDVVAIGKRIRARRLELDLSQRTVSRPGLSQAYISRLESGERLPNMHTLTALAEQLDTTALYLLTGDDQIPCPLCGRHEQRRSTNGKHNSKNIHVRRVRT